MSFYEADVSTKQFPKVITLRIKYQTGLVWFRRGFGLVLTFCLKKKCFAGCSTVIIPARVVEALKLHFDKLGVPSTFSSDIPPFHGTNPTYLFPYSNFCSTILLSTVMILQ